MTEEYTIIFRETTMRRDIRNIRYALCDIAEAEATKLYRLAWRMQEHGCDPTHIRKCREEASELHMTGYPERVITGTWEYAFKY